MTMPPAGVRPGAEEGGLVEIEWIANLFRGDDFEEIMKPAAEMALRFGASAQLFLRSKEDPLHFKQLIWFASKLDFDRYWQSDEMSQARIQASGLYQIPVIPIWHRVVSQESVEGPSSSSSSPARAEPR